MENVKIKLKKETNNDIKILFNDNEKISISSERTLNASTLYSALEYSKEKNYEIEAIDDNSGEDIKTIYDVIKKLIDEINKINNENKNNEQQDATEAQ